MCLSYRTDRHAVASGALDVLPSALPAAPFSACSEGSPHAVKYLTSLVHDLRQPLFGMIGISEVLAADHADYLNEAGSHLLVQLRTLVRRMDGLVDELQDYLRLSTDGAELQPVPLSPLIIGVAAAMRRRIDGVGGWLDLVVEECVARAHPGILERALGHLLDNAVKFAKPGEMPWVRIAVKRRGTRIRIEVEDAGTGIPAGDRERIFQPFERISRGEVQPGAGLGLAIARAGVESMGGAVGVDSRDGEGSLFWIELDADEPPVE